MPGRMLPMAARAERLQRRRAAKGVGTDVGTGNAGTDNPPPPFQDAIKNSSVVCDPTKNPVDPTAKEDEATGSNGKSAPQDDAFTSQADASASPNGEKAGTSSTDSPQADASAFQNGEQPAAGTEELNGNNKISQDNSTNEKAGTTSSTGSPQADASAFQNGMQTAAGTGEELNGNNKNSQDNSTNGEPGDSPPKGAASASQNGEQTATGGDKLRNDKLNAGDSPLVDASTSQNGEETAAGGENNGLDDKDSTQNDAPASRNGDATAIKMQATPTGNGKRKAAKEEASAAMKSANDILLQLGGFDGAAKLLEGNGQLQSLFQSLVACKDTSMQAIMDLEKKPRTKKRSLFDPAERLSQVKDDQVRKKCKAVLESFQTLQNAANYQDKDQRDVLPTCDFIMVCRDEMLPNVTSCKDGLWKRKHAMWTFLVPRGADVKRLGVELEAVGKSMAKKGRSTKDCLLITESSDAFQKALYGKSYGKKKGSETQDERKQEAV